MELETSYWHGLKKNMISDNQSNIDIALLIKCALEAGAKIIKGNAGFPAGICVQGKPIDIEEIFEHMRSSNNCQDK